MHEDFLRIVTLFRQYQDTGEDNYKEQAETLLNEIIDNCNNCKDLSYYNGLCGIGSVIEYLIQNNFVEGEADEILEDIDNAVISVINNRPQMGINIKEGLLGLVCYLYERLHYRIKLENSTVFTLKEHTIYLIDWLEDILSDTKAEINYSVSVVVSSAGSPYPVLPVFRSRPAAPCSAAYPLSDCSALA